MLIFFWQRSGALVEAQSTARMGEDESSCASGSGREDDEPACDVSADFLAGVSCYVDRFRRASVTVRPRARSFVVATRRTRRVVPPRARLLTAVHPHPTASRSQEHKD